MVETRLQRIARLGGSIREAVESGDVSRFSQELEREKNIESGKSYIVTKESGEKVLRNIDTRKDEAVVLQPKNTYKVLTKEGRVVYRRGLAFGRVEEIYANPIEVKEGGETFIVSGKEYSLPVRDKKRSVDRVVPNLLEFEQMSLEDKDYRDVKRLEVVKLNLLKRGEKLLEKPRKAFNRLTGGRGEQVSRGVLKKVEPKIIKGYNFYEKTKKDISSRLPSVKEEDIRTSLEANKLIKKLPKFTKEAIVVLNTLPQNIGKDIVERPVVNVGIVKLGYVFDKIPFIVKSKNFKRFVSKLPSKTQNSLLAKYGGSLLSGGLTIAYIEQVVEQGKKELREKGTLSKTTADAVREVGLFEVGRTLKLTKADKLRAKRLEWFLKDLPKKERSKIARLSIEANYIIKGSKEDVASLKRFRFLENKRLEKDAEKKIERLVIDESKRPLSIEELQLLRSKKAKEIREEKVKVEKFEELSKRISLELERIEKIRLERLNKKRLENKKRGGKEGYKLLTDETRKTAKVGDTFLTTDGKVVRVRGFKDVEVKSTGGDGQQSILVQKLLDLEILSSKVKTKRKFKRRSIQDVKKKVKRFTFEEIKKESKKDVKTKRKSDVLVDVKKDVKIKFIPSVDISSDVKHISKVALAGMIISKRDVGVKSVQIPKSDVALNFVQIPKVDSKVISKEKVDIKEIQVFKPKEVQKPKEKVKTKPNVKPKEKVIEKFREIVKPKIIPKIKPRVIRVPKPKPPEEPVPKFPFIPLLKKKKFKILKFKAKNFLTKQKTAYTITLVSAKKKKNLKFYSGLEYR